MKLENSIQDNKTIQNLKFNSETKLVRGSPVLVGQALPLQPQGLPGQEGGLLSLQSLGPSAPSPLLACPPLLLSVCLQVWPEQHFQADKALVCPEEDNPV